MDLDVRGWSAERKAMTVGVAVLAVVSVGGAVVGVPFGTRTFLAVAAGLVALLLASYVLTGSLLPPDEEHR